MEFVKELWRGNASLPFSYWVVAVIGNALFTITDRILDGAGYYDFITEGMLIFIWGFIIVSTGYFLFTVVCVWRSATKYEGKTVWAILAKIAMVLGTLKTLGALAHSFQ
jgi:hypothetical protein